MILQVTSPHPKADELLKRAIENYATLQASLAVQSATRPLHAGETEEARKSRVDTFINREAAAWCMAQSIHITTP